jgi:hypothetical protein
MIWWGGIWDEYIPILCGSHFALDEMKHLSITWGFFQYFPKVLVWLC